MNNEISLEERKAQNLLNIRGYKLRKREEQNGIISLLAEVPRRKELVLIWCIPNKVVGVAYAEKMRKAMETSEAKKGILVSCIRYTYAAKVRSRKYGIELIPGHFPIFNIFEHELVPKHEILSPEEVKELLEKYRTQAYKLPRIKASDIVAIAIGAKPGDILRIIRDSPTAGKSISYRQVVPD